MERKFIINNISVGLVSRDDWNPKPTRLKFESLNFGILKKKGLRGIYFQNEVIVETSMDPRRTDTFELKDFFNVRFMAGK